MALLASSAPSTATTAREATALPSATEPREPATALRRQRLAHRTGNHVSDQFLAFLQLAIQCLNQLSLLTVADAQAEPYALQLASFVDPDLAGCFRLRQRAE